MKVFVINLDKDRDRWASVSSQLDRLNVPYERVSAVYAKELPQVELERAVNRFRWWCSQGRPIRVGEIGCAMSHYSIYRNMTEPVCVLEDDVILAKDFEDRIKEVRAWLDIRKPQVVLLSNHSSESGLGIRPSKGDQYTEGYILTPLAATALLNVNWPLQRPCDHWWRWARSGIIQLYHAFPTVCRQDQSQYESGTSFPGCFRVDELGRVRWLAHKVLRIIGKLLDWILPL